MAETATARVNSELYSIVIAGAMNPPIHHPVWYQLVGIISEQEAQEAIKRDETMVVPVAARLPLPGGCEILCQQERWQIRTERHDQIDRMLEIAAKTFKVLDHTPVNAVGINANFIRQASVGNVGALLGSAARSLNLGIENAGTQTAEISMTWAERGRRFTAWIAPVADAPSFVSVRTNTQYQDFAELFGVHWDLDQLLRRHFHDDVQAARGHVEHVIEALKQRRSDGRQSD
jgi:hypothetical protein